MLTGTASGYANFSQLLPKDKYSRRARALGTDIVLTVFHHDKSLAELAVKDALNKVEHVEQLMSIYRPESQLSTLNREGVLRHPHPDFLAVLYKAQKLSELTQGAFDITVQPLWKLYVDHSRRGTLPSEVEISKVRSRVGWQHLHLTDDLIHMNKGGVQITLNGMAQGLAADFAQQALKNRGIQHALIDAGEFNAMGQPEERKAWHIAIKHNRQQNERLCKTSLSDRCLSTSGDYGTRFSEDYRHHHLFDPRTGFSPTQLSSVSVAAPSALEADALSTALFVLGTEKGMKLIESMDQVDAMFVDKSGHVEQTQGFSVL